MRAAQDETFGTGYCVLRVGHIVSGGRDVA
jgi:hypothetical protein